MKKSVKKKIHFFVYILKCADDTLYTGYTIDLEHRLKLHNAGQGAKYLRGRRPVQLAYVKRYKNLKAALQAEFEIKRLKRSQKENLVRKYAKSHPGLQWNNPRR